MTQSQFHLEECLQAEVLVEEMWLVLCKLHMPKKFDKATKKSLDQLRDSLNGKGNIVDRVTDDAERKASLIIPQNLDCSVNRIGWFCSHRFTIHHSREVYVS